MKTPLQVAQWYVGVKEIPGTQDNPTILRMLKLDGDWPEHDEVPWCSAFVNYCCHEAGYERSHKLNARSWINVGAMVHLSEAQAGDVVVLNRPPSPTNGHVGFFVGRNASDRVLLLGGNQGDQVCVAAFHPDRVIAVRRLKSVSEIS